MLLGLFAIGAGFISGRPSIFADSHQGQARFKNRKLRELPYFLLVNVQRSRFKARLRHDTKVRKLFDNGQILA